MGTYVVGVDASASQNVYTLAEAGTGRIVKQWRLKEGAFHKRPTEPVDAQRPLDAYAARKGVPLDEAAHEYFGEHVLRFLAMPPDAVAEGYLVRGPKVEPSDVQSIGMSVAGRAYTNGDEGTDVTFLGGNTPVRFAADDGGRLAINGSKSLRREFPRARIRGGNDCNCTGLAQSIYYEGLSAVQGGSVDPAASFYITLSTGIGAGGPKDDVDEVGHMPVSNIHPALRTVCGCNGVDHLECFGSGTGIANLAKRIIELYRRNPSGHGPFRDFAEYERLGGRLRLEGGEVDLGKALHDSALKDVLRRKGSGFSAIDVFDAAKAQDAFARYVLDTTARMTAEALVGLAQVHGLGTVGVGGGVGEHQPEYVADIGRKAARMLEGNTLLRRSLSVEVTPLGEVANDYGALSLVTPEDPLLRSQWAKTIYEEALRRKGPPQKLSPDSIEFPPAKERSMN